MLRRNDRLAQAENWLLISQVEHARLAYDLASSWTDSGLTTIDPHAQFLDAVAHHDDGWTEWDAAPDVDPATGRPLSFTEMPQVASITIWKRSIDRAASLGPLAAHVTSAHFTALLQAAATRWSTDTRTFQASRDFLNDQSERRQQWFAEWQAGNSTSRTRAMVDRALAYLQFFDALSLWICGAVRLEEETFPTPAGVAVSFRPNGENCFAVRPWPYADAHRGLTVSTRRVPIARYANRAELAAVPWQEASITFELTLDA